MATAIVYYSRHHGNTKKLLDAIAKDNEVTLIDATASPEADLSGYDRIGFASGIYYSAFAKQLVAYASGHLPENRDVFYLYTHGAPGISLRRSGRSLQKSTPGRSGHITVRALTPLGPSSWWAELPRDIQRRKSCRGRLTFIGTCKRSGEERRLPT